MTEWEKFDLRLDAIELFMATIAARSFRDRADAERWAEWFGSNLDAIMNQPHRNDTQGTAFYRAALDALLAKLLDCFRRE